MGYEPDCNCPDCVAMRNGVDIELSYRAKEKKQLSPAFQKLSRAAKGKRP